VAIFVVGLIAYSTWARFQFLTSSPFPMGIDGYFYPIQLRSLLERGVLYYPSSPMALYAMAPLAAVTDPITGARLGAALGGALIAWPAYAVGTRLAAHRVGGMVAASVAVVSAGSYYLSVEFVKNAWGLAAGLGVVWATLRALEAPSRRRVALAAALLAVTFLTHKMGAAIAVILLVPTTFVGLRARGHFSRLRPVHVLIGAAALLLGVLGLGLVMPERFFSRGDLALFADLLSSHAEWTAPAMSLRPDGPNPYVLTMDSEALLAGLVGVLAVASLWRRRDAIAPPVRALGLTIAGFAILLALPWLDVADPDGLGFRMRIVAFLPLALCLAIVVGATLREFGVAAQPRRVHAAVMAAIVALCLAWVLTRPRDRHAGVVKTDADMVAAISAAGAYTGTDYVIVSERHVGFMAQYYSTADVHLITERFPRDRAWRLITGNFIGKHRGLREAIERARALPGVAPPLGLHPSHPTGIVLMREATWQRVVELVDGPAQARLRAWFNPDD
jgi:hypothetical protein